MNAAGIATELRRVRQIRQYRPDPVPGAVLAELLEVARWTGSSRDSQPWHFVVLTERDRLRQVSRGREAINWVAGAPLAIAIVLDGRDESGEAYDEGRVTERLLVAARFVGVGGGTARYGNAEQQAMARRILGVPEGRTARSLVALGYPSTTEDPPVRPRGRRTQAALGDRQP